MKHPQRKPSVGFWLIIASWSAAVLFIVWGASTPPLDQFTRELRALELNDTPTAPPHLVSQLEDYSSLHPELGTSLAGESGARVLEAQRDGWAHGKQFVVVTRKSPPEQIQLEASEPTRVRLTFHGESIELTSQALHPGRVKFPPAWKERGRVLRGERLEGSGPIRLSGVTEAGAQ